ncbi:MAG: sugar transferase [Aquisalimonadaceae bacterium]
MNTDTAVDTTRSAAANGAELRNGVPASAAAAGAETSGAARERTIAPTSKRTLIVGEGRLARDLVREINARPGCGYKIVGSIGEGSTTSTDSAGDFPVAPLDDAQRIIDTLQPDRIIVALAELRGRLPVRQLLEARICRGVDIEEGVEVYERLTGKLAIELLTPSSVIFSRDFRPSRFSLIMARGMSIITSLIALIGLAPLMGLIALAIRLDSPGSILFVQDRIGMAGRPFKLLKFRTMRPDAGHQSEWARDNDHRITRVGRWLRKYRLDELPQFVNVLRGDMNLVGPRPHPASNFELLAMASRNTPECGVQIPYYSLRTMIPPGITGWAQVRYRYANNLDEEIEKMRYDLHYVKHLSLSLDLRILLETVKIVLAGSGSEDPEEALTKTPD